MNQVLPQEEELVFLLQHNNQLGFQYLYRHYAPVLYSRIRMILKDEGTAQDALQETFCKVWLGIKSYDCTKGRLFTWMNQIARNIALDVYRSKAQGVNRKTVLTAEFICSPATHSHINDWEDAVGVSRMLKNLDNDQQRLIHLVYFQGCTMAEAADELEIPVGTVKTRLRRTMNRLRTINQVAPMLEMA